MPEQLKELETMRIKAFTGGMNTSAPANDIADDECVLIRNKEYDDGDNLVTRNGVTGRGGIVGVWDETLWDSSLWDSLSVEYSTPITSILDFEGASSFVGILLTVGTDLFSETLSGVRTTLTGALSLPDGVRWHWRIFNGVAVGVNGLTSGHNPVQVVAPAPGTASHLTTAPVGRFIEVWASRLWIARSDQKNQLQASNIGSHTGWDTDAGANPAHGALWDLDKDDGDEITGLYSEKERLFVFKQNSIFVGEAKDPTKPITDVRNISFRKYSTVVGCIAGTTIRPVLDDVFFLAKGGVASLRAAQIVADFESALVSLKIKDIQNIRQDLSQEDVFAYVLTDRNQYILCVSENASATSKNVSYVFDYRQIKKGIARWVLFDGFAFGTSIEVFDHDVQNLVYLLGCHDTESDIFFLGKYIPKARDKFFSDGNSAISEELITKSYDFEFEDLRKYLSEWFLRFFSLTPELSLSISYFFDDESDSVGDYSFNISVDLGGIFFDDPSSMFDNSSLFDEGSKTVSHRIRQAFLYGTPEDPKPRKAVTVQFRILNDQPNQGYGITGFGIKYQVLSEYNAATI